MTRRMLLGNPNTVSRGHQMSKRWLNRLKEGQESWPLLLFELCQIVEEYKPLLYSKYAFGLHRVGLLPDCRMVLRLIAEFLNVSYAASGGTLRQADCLFRDLSMNQSRWALHTLRRMIRVLPKNPLLGLRETWRDAWKTR